MSLQKLAKANRGHFALHKPIVFREGTLNNEYGMFVFGKRSHTVIIDVERCGTSKMVLATILHEYIHAEQADAGMSLDHGMYFQERRKEMAALTGLSI